LRHYEAELIYFRKVSSERCKSREESNSERNFDRGSEVAKVAKVARSIFFPNEPVPCRVLAKHIHNLPGFLFREDEDEEIGGSEEEQDSNNGKKK